MLKPPRALTAPVRASITQSATTHGSGHAVAPSPVAPRDPTVVTEQARLASSLHTHTEESWRGLPVHSVGMLPAVHAQSKAAAAMASTPVPKA